MFILKIFMFFMWALVILVFGSGLLGVVLAFAGGESKDIALAIVALVVGGLAFYGVYSLLDSFFWCFLVSGGLMSAFTLGGESGRESISNFVSGGSNTNTPANRNYNEYSGSSVRYGDHTLYSSGNASNRYGDTEYFNNDDAGTRYGDRVYYKSGGYSVDSKDVTYYYDKNGKETGRCVHNGNSDSYYGVCGPHTSGE